MRFLLIAAFCICLPLKAQPKDTFKLSVGAVLMSARQYHPVAKQAQLLPDEAAAYLRYARGSFDPKLFYDRDNKFYDGKTYYNYENLGLKIPTWFGVDVMAGVDYSRGQYVNPEDVTPSGGLTYIGLSAPLLRNLITDVRRTQLNKAKLLQTQNKWLQNEILNELGAEILNDYTDWYFSHREKLIYEQAIIALNTRLSAIKSEFTAGGKSAMDTIETAAQLNQFQINFQDANAKEQKSAIYVYSHLWTTDGMPLEPAVKPAPDLTGLSFADSLVKNFNDSVMLQNLDQQPTLAALNIERSSAELDVRLKKQALLPDLSLKYNSLSPGLYNYSNQVITDYKFGLNFSSSLFLRKERGEYRLSRIKLSSYDFKIQQKNRELTQKIKAAWLQMKAYESMTNTARNMVSNTEKLFENEKIRFNAGDATVFMVNTRETKLIESRLKLLEVEKKYLRSKIEYLSLSGLLYTLF